MSDKVLDICELDPNTTDNIDFTNYLNSQNFEIGAQIAHLRNKENKENLRKVNALHARHAVEDVLEMIRYRELHKDYYRRA